MDSERVNSEERTREWVPESTAKAGLPGVKVCLSPGGSTTARHCWTSQSQSKVSELIVSLMKEQTNHKQITIKCKNYESQFQLSRHVLSVSCPWINWWKLFTMDQNRKSDIMWEFPIIQSETMLSQQEIPVSVWEGWSNYVQQKWKENRMVVAWARVAMWVSVAKVVLAFSVQFLVLYLLCPNYCGSP